MSLPQPRFADRNVVPQARTSQRERRPGSLSPTPRKSLSETSHYEPAAPAAEPPPSAPVPVAAPAPAATEASAAAPAQPDSAGASAGGAAAPTPKEQHTVQISDERPPSKADSAAGAAPKVEIKLETTAMPSKAPSAMSARRQAGMPKMMMDEPGPPPHLQQQTSSRNSLFGSSAEGTRSRSEHRLCSPRVVLPLVAVLVIIIVVCATVGGVTARS